MFKINSVDKNEDLNFKQKYLYLNAVKADQVKYVLTNGFSDDQRSIKEFGLVLRQVTSSLRLATHLSRISYCEIDDTVTKLSFVFVVCSKENYKDHKNGKLIEDSRESLTRQGIFCNSDYGVKNSIFDLVPAYLIIFKLDDK